MNPAQLPYRSTPLPGQVEYHIPSWPALLDVMTAAGHGSSSHGTSEPEFYGTPSWGAAISLAKLGWTGADETIRAISDSLVGRLGSLVETVAWQSDVAGEAVDMGAYLSGVPECMLTPTPRLQRGNRVYRIVAPIGGCAFVTAKGYEAAGAVAVALCELIELAGHQSEVIYVNEAEFHYGSAMRRIRVVVPIKSPGQPLDAPLLAFQAAHPSSHRRLMFAMREGDPDFADIGGTSYDYQHDETIPADFRLPTAETCEGYVGAGGTTEQLVAWLKAKLSAAGLID